MDKILEDDIRKLAVELKNRFELYHNYLQLWLERKTKIYTDPPQKTVKFPEEWARDKKFNPYYILKNSSKIAKSLSKKILSGKYEPHPHYVKSIPKPNGNGYREISIYQIQDSAVSDIQKLAF